MPKKPGYQYVTDENPTTPHGLSPIREQLKRPKVNEVYQKQINQLDKKKYYK